MEFDPGRRGVLKIVGSVIFSSYIPLGCTDRETEDLSDFLDNYDINNPSYDPDSLGEGIDENNGNRIYPVSIVDSENLVNGDSLIKELMNFPDVNKVARLSSGLFPTPGVIVRFDHNLWIQNGFGSGGSEVYVDMPWGYNDPSDIELFLVYSNLINKTINKDIFPIGWPPKYKFIKADSKHGTTIRRALSFNIDNAIATYGHTREIGLFFFGKDYDLFINYISNAVGG